MNESIGGKMATAAKKVARKTSKRRTKKRKPVAPTFLRTPQIPNFSEAAIYIADLCARESWVGKSYKNVKPIDLNKNLIFERKDDVAEETSTEQTGLFGINIHRANPSAVSSIIDKWSAGCQVLNDPKQFATLLAACEKSGKGAFTYTLVFGVIFSMLFISLFVYYINRLFSNQTKDILVRFILLIFASLVGVFIIDKVVAFGMPLLSDHQNQELFDLIKTLTLMIFSYYFGTQKSEKAEQ